MDIVRKLICTSPRDQVGYMIAAVSALGTVGEWEICSNMLETEEGIKMGPSFTAAVMNACTASGKWDQAVRIHGEFYDDHSLSPDDAARMLDALLRAYGAAPGGTSESALAALDAVFAQGLAPDASAVEAAVRSCERDDDAEGAVGVLEEVLIECVDGRLPLGAGAAASVMRACVRSGDPAGALLYGNIVGALRRPPGSEGTGLEDSFLTSSDEMLACTIECLWLLGESEKATGMYEDAIRDGDAWEKSTECFHGLREMSEFLHGNDDVDGETPPSSMLSFAGIRPMLDAVRATLDAPPVTTAREDDALLVSLLESFNAVRLPSMGLALARRTARLRSTGAPSDGGSMLGARDGPYIEDSYLTSSDDINAAVMRALILLGRQETAAEMFIERIAAEPELHGWRESSIECVLAFVEAQRFGDAIGVMDSVDLTTFTEDDFVIVANKFVENGRWDYVLDTWAMASDCERLTESLSLLALEAVTRSKKTPRTDRRGGILKSQFEMITEKMDSVLGLKKGEWAKSHEHHLTKRLGVEKRIVMRWGRGSTKKNDLANAVKTHRALKNTNGVADATMLSTIVRNAGYSQRHVSCQGEPKPDVGPGAPAEERERQEAERSAGVRLVQTAVRDAAETGLESDRNFALKVVFALRALKANMCVIEYVRMLSEKAVKVDLSPKFYLQGIFAAKSVGKDEFVDEMIWLMTKAGYSYQDKDDKQNNKESAPGWRENSSGFR